MNKHILLTIGLAVLLVSSGHAGQEQLARSIEQARAETGRTADQLKATVNALNALTRQSKGDLRPSYEAFCAEVGRTEYAAASTRSRIQWMAGQGRQYFRDWEQTVNGINNVSLQKKAQKRMKSVQEDYGDVEVALQQAADKFRPFLSDLNDIKETLASDVTPSGVKAVRSSARSANWNYQSVERAISKALKGMGKMEKALSSEVK